MRSEPNLRIEHYRFSPPGWGSPAGVNYGAFYIPYRGVLLRAISSGTDEEHGWEHVSVSLQGRCPTWAEMAYVKELFWSDDELALQFHPPKALHINFHPHCLHLWRPLRQTIELPPAILIGPTKKCTTEEERRDAAKEFFEVVDGPASAPPPAAAGAVDEPFPFP